MIHDWIANNERSGAGFPKLKLPGPCEQVFGFPPKSLFMRLFFVALLTRFSTVLLPVTERRVYFYITRWIEQSARYPWAAMACLWICSVCWVYHKLYLSEVLGRWICCWNGCFTRFLGRRLCSFGRRCAVRVAAAGNCAQGVSAPLKGFRKKK